MMPHALRSSSVAEEPADAMASAASAGCGRRGNAYRCTSRAVRVGRRHRSAVQAHPDAQHRVDIAVCLPDTTGRLRATTGSLRRAGVRCSRCDFGKRQLPSAGFGSPSGHHNPEPEVRQFMARLQSCAMQPPAPSMPPAPLHRRRPGTGVAHVAQFTVARSRANGRPSPSACTVRAVNSPRGWCACRSRCRGCLPRSTRARGWPEACRAIRSRRSARAVSADGTKRLPLSTSISKSAARGADPETLERAVRNSSSRNVTGWSPAAPRVRVKKPSTASNAAGRQATAQ